MTKNEEKIIQASLDQVLEMLAKEKFSSQYFASYSKISKGVFFSNLKLHKTSRNCSYSGCKKKSIKFSHSIPNSSVLQNIATNNHLLKPEVDMANKKLMMKMEYIGINEASTFPGFCSEHENKFQEFEIDGKIDSEKKALLQTYRSVCRERVYREIEIEIIEKQKKAYLEKLTEEARAYVEKELSLNGCHSKISKMEINNTEDNTIIFYTEIVKSLRNEIIPLERIEKSLFSYLFCSNEDFFPKVVLTIDIQIPVSLCGYATMQYQINENNDDRTAYIFLNVLPGKETTTIICVANQDDKGIFDAYTNYAFSDPMNILDMIESFMVNGSDHWFISPDYWYNIPENKQNKILFDILNTENSFLEPYRLSIFDDIRKKILDIFFENTKFRTLTCEEVEFVEREQNKLSMSFSPIEYDEEEVINSLLKKF